MNTQDEIRDAFTGTYRRILREKFSKEQEENGDIDRFIGAGYIDGSLLNDVSAEAAAEVVSGLVWRFGVDQRIQDALIDPDLYDAIDYDAIVAEFSPAPSGV